MENLKKNLHLVVFGSGVLVGIILLLAGMYIRGGKEDSLVAAQTGLPKPANVATKGTLDRATKRASEFSGTLNEATSALENGRSVNFNSDYNTYSSGSEFFTKEANAKLRELKGRFKDMEQPQPMPKLLENYSYTSSGTAVDTFDQLEKDMASPPNDKIRDYQRRLRILDELATTCERLLAAKVGTAFGVKLISIKFDEFGPWNANLPDAPWMAMGFQVLMECAPDFAVLLASELTNPTELTMSEDKKGHNRRGFPIFLEMMQSEMKERLPEVRFDIGNPEKAEVAGKVNDMAGKDDPKITVPDDPKQLDPATGEGKKLVDTVDGILNVKDQIALPVRVGFRLRAASFNKNWKVVAVPAEE